MELGGSSAEEAEAERRHYYVVPGAEMTSGIDIQVAQSAGLDHGASHSLDLEKVDAPQ